MTTDGITTDGSAAELADAYFTAWREADIETFATLLADDATFDGPMGRAVDAEECVAGMRRLMAAAEEIEVVHRWVDGDDVATWFLLSTTAATDEPMPVVNWTHATDGRITSIRVIFDPGPMLTD